MKLTDIFSTASSNIWRSKLRSFLTIIAIFIGAFTLTLTNGIGAGVSEYIDKQLGNLGARDLVVIQAKIENAFTGGPQEYNPDQTLSGGIGITAGMPVLTDSDLEKISENETILSIEPMVQPVPDYIEGVGEKKFTFTAQPYFDGTNLDIASGQLPDNNADENQVVLSMPYIEPLEFASDDEAIGQIVKIGITSGLGQQHIVEAKIVGVQQETLLSTFGGAQINTALLNTLNEIQIEGLPDAQVNQYFALVARINPDFTDEDLTAIKNELDEQGYSATTFDDQVGSFKQVIGAITMILSFFAAIALLAASFGIINTLLMAVQERTKEIGLSKAMGMSGSKIFMLFSTEAILLGLWGSVLGVLAGIGAGQIANGIASETFLKDLPGFNLMAFPAESLLIIVGIILAIAFLAGTLPARQASRKDPIEALRYE